MKYTSNSFIGIFLIFYLLWRDFLNILWILRNLVIFAYFGIFLNFLCIPWTLNFGLHHVLRFFGRCNYRRFVAQFFLWVRLWLFYLFGVFLLGWFFYFLLFLIEFGFVLFLNLLDFLLLVLFFHLFSIIWPLALRIFLILPTLFLPGRNSLLGFGCTLLSRHLFLYFTLFLRNFRVCLFYYSFILKPTIFQFPQTPILQFNASHALNTSQAYFLVGIWPF